MSTIIKAKVNGTTYCYRSESYWDKETKSSKSKRILIGKIDPDTGEMVPTQPRGGRQSKHADEFSAAEMVKPVKEKDEKNLDYKEKYEKTNAKLVSAEKELAQMKAERDEAVRKFKQLSKAVREAASLA